VEVAEQLAEAVGSIAKADCPGRWPELPALLAAELGSAEPARKFSACIMATAVLQKYAQASDSSVAIARGSASVVTLGDGRRFTPRDVMDAIFAAAEPPLLAMARASVAADPSDVAASMLLSKSLGVWGVGIKHDVTGVLATPDSLTGWFTVVDATIAKELPAKEGDCHDTLRDSPWWVAKGEAVRAVAKFVEGHASFALSAEHLDAVRESTARRVGESAAGDVPSATRSKAVAGRFFAERLLVRLWDTVSSVLMRGGPCTDTFFSSALNVVQGIIAPEFAAIFAEHVRPRFSALMTHVILPAAVLPAGEAAMAEHSPEEFIREFQKDFVHDSARRRDKATETVAAIFRARADSLGKPFLSWAAKQLVQMESVPAERRNWLAKEAILTTLCFAAGHIIEEDDLCAIVEPILVRFCAPELGHPHPAMKARALALFAQFINPAVLSGFRDTSIATKTVAAALAGLADPNQAVQYQAACLIMSAATVPSVRPLLRANLRAVIAKFFQLIADLNVGGVAESLFYIISTFAVDIAVDAPGLVDMVAAALHRAVMATEDDESEHADWAASHLVLCLDAIVSSPAITPRMAAVLEPRILPVLHAIFRVGPAMNYFDEGARVVNSLVRANRRVTPGLWTLFGPLVRMGTTYCVDFIEELAPVIDTFVVVDPATFLTVVPGTAMEDAGADVTPLELMMHIVRVMDRRDDSDRAHGAFVMNSVLTCMPGAIDGFVTHLVRHYATGLANDRGKPGGIAVGGARTALASAIGTAFLYNAPLTLEAMATPELRAAVFTAMADPLVDPANYSGPALVHKSIMLGLMRVLRLDPAALPADVARMFPAILQTAVGYAHERLQLVRAAEEDSGARDEADDERDYDAATAEEAAEYAGVLAGLGVDPAAAEAKAAAGPKPMVIGEATLGEVSDLHGFHEDWADVEDQTPEDVDFMTLDASRVAGDVAVLQVDTLLEFDALMTHWRQPARASALAAMSAGISPASREQIGALAAACAEHKDTLGRRTAMMAAQRAGAPSEGAPMEGQAGDPALHTVLSVEAVHAVAAVADMARARLAAYTGTVPAGSLAQVDAAAAAAASAAPAGSGW